MLLFILYLTPMNTTVRFVIVVIFNFIIRNACWRELVINIGLIDYWLSSSKQYFNCTLAENKFNNQSKKYSWMTWTRQSGTTKMYVESLLATTVCGTPQLCYKLCSTDRLFVLSPDNPSIIHPEPAPPISTTWICFGQLCGLSPIIHHKYPVYLWENHVML